MEQTKNEPTKENKAAPETGKPKKEREPLTEAQRLKRQKMIVLPAMVLVFIGAMWLIFAPSSGKEQPPGTDGYNTEMPDADKANRQIIGDKLKAYEHGEMEERQESRNRAIGQLGDMFDREIAGTENGVDFDLANPGGKEERAKPATPQTIQSSAAAYRDRPIEENLRLFEKMKNGEVEEGKMTLRAKIDLASGNFNMRDPVIYRIRFINHHRQGTKWCIFPMYDFAHPIQDALEGITHSLCSLEYEEHRPLYDWVVNNVSIPYHKPRQIEFARLNIDHTVMSKRKLRKLVEEHYVSGWDDPRMPTLCGLRRRGYTAASIRNFCEMIGVGKTPSVIEYGTLEHCLREDLNATAERTMAVLHPVKLTVTNYPEGKSEVFTVENNPTDPAQGTHEITFSRHLWIEAEDFMEVPVPKYKRLTPNGPECRLKGAYLVQCTGCVKDADGNVTEVLCTYDPESSGGDPADGRKVKGATLHWVDAENCMDAEVRLYDNLFSDEQPDGPDKDFLDCLNPESLTVLTGCKVEPEMRKVAEAFDKQADRTGVNAPTFQFMRVGYFCLDNRDSSAAHMVFNRSVSLKDSFKK